MRRARALRVESLETREMLAGVSALELQAAIAAIPPTAVSAGTDLQLKFGETASLDGTVTLNSGDPRTLVIGWSKVQGPGKVTFANAAAIDTTAQFSVAGTYVLQLAGTNGGQTASDQVIVTVTPPVNLAPLVNAGQDQQIVISAGARLDGTVSDDGLPSSPGKVTSTWTKVSGPGTVTFANAAAIDTTAQFSTTGTYVLRLTASDGALTSKDEITIAVNAASPSGTITLEAEAAKLTSPMSKRSQSGASGGAYVATSTANQGSVQFTFNVQEAGDYTILARVLATTSAQDSFFVSVDGGPEDVFDVAEKKWSNSWQWSAVNGRGGTGTPLTLDPRVFTLSAGSHTITFRGREAGAGLDQIQIVRSGGTTTNQAPQVSAGKDQSIALSAAAALDGTVNDDGRPNPPGTVTSAWTKVSGPGTVTFANAAAADTTAKFSTAGTYVLRLTASDGALTAQDDMVVTVTTVPQSGSVFYVAANGSPNGDGSINRPWDLQTALSQPAAVKPGDTIYLRGGTYRGAFASTLTGTADKPIVVRPYEGEHVQIDTYDGTKSENYFTVRGDYTNYVGMEITSSSPLPRFTQDVTPWPEIRRGGLYIYGDYDKFINMVIHDVDTVGFWADGAGGEIYGSLIYNTGWVNTQRSRGVGIYTQNGEGVKRIVDNVIFNSFENGIQAYGSESASVDGYYIEGNTFFNASAAQGVGYDRGYEIVIGGGSPAANVTFTNNYTFHNGFNGVADLGYLFGVTNENITVTDNYFATAVRFWQGWEDLTFTGNTIVNGSKQAVVYEPVAGTQVWDNNKYYSTATRTFTYDGTNENWSQWRQSSKFDSHSQFTAGNPTGTQVFVRPNQYEEGRANVTVYNWDRASQVSVDLSSTLSIGDRYEIHNVLDMFGTPVVSGVYDGKPIRLPMRTTTSPRPISYDLAAPVTVGPEFGTFVVTAVGSSSGLEAAEGPAVGEACPQDLTAEALTPIVDYAVAQWTAHGLRPEQAAALEAVRFQIADLAGGRLGEARGTVITLDSNAAGYGWFVDATPGENEEFGVSGPSGRGSSTGSPAAERMDLVTAVMHELGHVLGYNHTDPLVDADGLMADVLSGGIRRDLDLRLIDMALTDGP